MNCKANGKSQLITKSMLSGVLVALFTLVPVMTFVFGVGPIMAQVADAPGQLAEQGASEEDRKVEEILKNLMPKDSFVYSREGRPDPFLPFVSEARVQAELASEEEKLTGMQLFEPGQLVLVSIMTVGGEPLAMVQDSVGKGYVIKMGMKIGRKGVITDIASNQVLVRELASFNSRTKKKIYKTTKMVLRKEGENK